MHFEQHTELDNLIAMQNLRTSANKGSNEAYDVSTSLAGYEPNDMVFSELSQYRSTHISLHDQPCHKTMKKYEDFEGMVISLLHPRKLAIQTWFCNCPQYLCLFHIVGECSPSTRDPGKMLVLPNRLLCW